MAKGVVLLMVAAMLDIFQGLIMLSFMGVVTIASGTLALIPIVGAGAAGAVSVGGMLMGYVIDFSLSIGFGSFLIMLMALNDALSWRALMWGTPVELLLPFLPGWTAIVAGSLYTKYKADKARPRDTNEATA